MVKSEAAKTYDEGYAAGRVFAGLDAERLRIQVGDQEVSIKGWSKAYKGLQTHSFQLEKALQEIADDFDKRAARMEATAPEASGLMRFCAKQVRATLAGPEPIEEPNE
ncbi:hypothetical protein LCGC14_2181200 [marine sediment metagenome]|uniref:Uncharacterized protein n=1 Tax=marine sediment metagenome TaxID=412755 RepID=A0A0F9FZT0_9ZZZZ